MALNSSSSSSFFDALYCSEENWEEEYSVEVEGGSFFNDGVNNNNQSNPFITLLEEHDLTWEDDDELSSLLSKEEHNNQIYDSLLQSDVNLARARLDAVEWMLKVNAHYSFSALTAVLAVNYLDRFLFSFRLQSDKPWMTQLAAVACVSLAAKVEETQVPLLLDLQVEESKYLFEPKTIQRMEILVLSTLEWRMNPVTPLSFLDYIARRLGLIKDHHLCFEFLRRCHHLLLSAISDSRFMCYLPSVMATATMLHVVEYCVEPNLRVEYQNQILGIILGIDKDKVDECCKLVTELAATRVQVYQSNKRRFSSSSIPGSPNGVMDVSFSSDDSSNDSWAVASPEPLSKKSRTQLLEKLSNDPLSIPP